MFPFICLPQSVGKILIANIKFTTLDTILAFLILGERLHDFNVDVLNYNPEISSQENQNKTPCGTYEGVVSNGDWAEVMCAPGARGSYVRIQIPGDSQALSLCEVEVFSDGKYSIH